MNSLEDIDIDDYWSIIKYNYDQIRFAEIKASAVISLYSILLTLGYTLDVLDDENVYDFSFESFEAMKLLSFIPAVYFTFQSLRSCISCILPRLNIVVEKSPLFFGDFNKYKDFDEYFSSLHAVFNNEENYKKHLSQSVYATGKIAIIKFLNINRAIKSLLYSILSFIVFLITLYIV